PFQLLSRSVSTFTALAGLTNTATRVAAGETVETRDSGVNGLKDRSASSPRAPIRPHSLRPCHLTAVAPRATPNEDLRLSGALIDQDRAQTSAAGVVVHHNGEAPLPLLLLGSSSHRRQDEKQARARKTPRGAPPA